MKETPEQFKQRLRRFEERLQGDMKNIFCPTHLCIGQEDVPAVLNQALTPDDWVFSTHRAHGHYLAKGGSEKALWDEIHGLESGLNGGFSGSQGFSDEKLHFYCSAIVGGLVGVATGTAYALKMNNSNAIVVCCIGDAGVEQGVFWESLNFSVLHRLPICYVCENNQKSVDAHISERQATPITQRVKAFGVNTWTYEGGLEGMILSARRGIPSFYEAKVSLLCDHLNMSTLLPTFDLVAA